MAVLRRHTSFSTFTTIFHRSRINDDDGCFRPLPFVVYAENPSSVDTLQTCGKSD
ncbi:hypothetical protein Hdeb2414_s0167g00821141 [Helianthus debilis subsp. tardiflorus]